MERLKHGSFKLMTPEEQRKHLNMLMKRWRDNNPKKVKERNKYYFELYNKTKPFKCVCVKCGNEFNAKRSSRKICPVCKNIGPQRKQEKLIKRQMKEHLKEMVKSFYVDMNYTQKQIAEIVGYTQECVSKWLRQMGVETRANKKKV